MKKIIKKIVLGTSMAALALSLFGSYGVGRIKGIGQSENFYIAQTNLITKAESNGGVAFTEKEKPRDWDFDGISDDYVTYSNGTTYIRSSKFLKDHPFKASWEKTFIREDLLPLRQEGILSELRHLDSLVSDLESGKISYAPDNTIIQSRQSKLDELGKNYPGAYSKYVQGKNN